MIESVVPATGEFFAPRIEISLDALVHNLTMIRRRIPLSAGIIAVVKNCAYGCGAVPVCRTLETEGVGFFAVITAGEARDLRAAGIRGRILVLGECTIAEFHWLAENGVHCALNDLASLERFVAAGRGLNVHVNVDTGMGRMGLRGDEVDAAACFFSANPNMTLAGIYTHFAAADVPGTLTVDAQRTKLAAAIEVFRARGLNPHYIHSSNSAALQRFDLPAGHLVRTGITLYGCRPDPAQDFGLEVRPVARLVAHVVKVKRVPAGTPVSYGGTYVTPAVTTILTIGLGYAHGLPRMLSNRGEVLIRGRRYRIAGRVTMDYIMVDAGPESDIAVGDEVVAMGSQGNDVISADEIARHCGTIAYEILCHLTPRIDRYFIRHAAIESFQPGRLY
jgi:alanine racemase